MKIVSKDNSGNDNAKKRNCSMITTEGRIAKIENKLSSIERILSEILFEMKKMNCSSAKFVSCDDNTALTGWEIDFPNNDSSCGSLHFPED